MALYNKGVLKAAPQGGMAWGRCVWAGMGRTKEH